MTPLTLADAEQRLRAVLAGGDPEQIAAHVALVDRLDNPPPPPTPLEAALWYIGVGLHVFRLAENEKVPRAGSSGVLDATGDAAVVSRWWAEQPTANVGIATGHLVDVIDIDGPEGIAGFVRELLLCEACADAAAHGGGAPVHCDECSSLHDDDVLGIVSTPRPGGLHLYVPAVEGMRNGAALLPSVDMRALGGYVVAPPSVTDVGTYTWLYPLDVQRLRAGP